MKCEAPRKSKLCAPTHLCWPKGLIVLGWVLGSGVATMLGKVIAPPAEGESPRSWRSFVGGGLGSWVAHFVWIDPVVNDPQRAPEQAVARIRDACSWDPGNPFFRTQGAGILAFDLGMEAGGVSAEGYALEALQLLDEGRPWCDKADLAAIDFVYATILSARLNDPEQASMFFRRAAGELSDP